MNTAPGTVDFWGMMASGVRSTTTTQRGRRETTGAAYIREPVAPVAYQVILEPGIVQFRESEPPPSAYSYKFVGTFSRAQIDLRKARERELTTLDEKSTSSGIAEP